MLSSVTPRLLRLLSLLYRARDSIRYRWRSIEPSVDQRSAFYHHVWLEAATGLGAAVKELGDGILEIEFDGRRIKVCANYTPFDDPVTLMLAGNKILVHRLLMDRGLPIPRHLPFTLRSIQSAENFLERTAGEYVVKPAKNTGAGAGVTTGVATRSRLWRAAARAATYGRDLLIEEQVQGDNYRLLYLDGILLDAVVRKPPRVIGDGLATVRELIHALNRERSRAGHAVAQVLVTIDRDAIHTLAKQGLTLSTVPAKGQEVVIKTVINDNAGPENETVTHQLCTDIIAAGSTAASAVGVRLAGVDIITPDPSRPLSETGGVVLEVNTAPGFYFHYRKSGEPFPVAQHVLASIFGLSRPDNALPHPAIPIETSGNAPASRKKIRTSTR